MALATRCPACSTVFRISTAQAAAKSGMVRCGICANVFNSLDALVRVEELDVVEEVIVAAPVIATASNDDGLEAPEDLASASPDRDATRDVPIAADPPAAMPVVAPGPMPIPTPIAAPTFASFAAEAATPTFASVATGLATTQTSTSIVAKTAAPVPEPTGTADPILATTIEPPGTLQSIAPAFAAIAVPSSLPPSAPRSREAERVEPTLADAGEDAIIREWWMPEAAPAERAPLSGPITPPYSGRPTETREPLSPLLSGRRDEARLDASSIDGTNPVFMRPEAEPERGSRAMRWTLGFLSLVAVVALLAQLAYLWRDELAARWSPARPWLAAACRALDCELGYPTHADSITIESATVQSSGANSNLYVLSALLRNRDAIDLRYPHLELVLTDLQDRPILRRDLRPEDYLGNGRSPTSGFAAQSELPIRLTFELDKLRFAGYRLNQFYP